MNYSERSTRMLAVAFAAAAFFVVVLAALLGSRVTGAANTKLIDDFGQLVASAVAAGCCLVIALRAAGLRRAAWALIGAYAGIWAGSELVWLLFDLSSDTQKPFPSIAAIGFVAAVPLAVAGSLAFGLRGGAHLSAVVRALDAVTVGVALMLICWFPVLERVFQTSSVRGRLRADEPEHPDRRHSRRDSFVERHRELRVSPTAFAGRCGGGVRLDLDC